MQQQGRDNLERQRRHVVGASGLAATVGRLALNGVWAPDRLHLISAGRRGFSLTVYRALLPKLWDEWDVARCAGHVTAGKRCLPPTPGPLLEVGRLYQYDYVVDFNGLVPKQTPCEAAAFLQVSGNRNCRWASLQDGGYGPLVKILTDPVPAECRYDPATGSSWRYGCPLGVSPSLMVKGGAKSPWMFRLRRCTYPDYNAPSRSCHVAQE